MILILQLKISQRIYPPETVDKIKELDEVQHEVTPIKMQNQEPTSTLNEEEPMRNSCVAPSDGGVESAKEKDERTILDEPMVLKALELFEPKKVRVKRKN